MSDLFNKPSTKPSEETASKRRDVSYTGTFSKIPDGAPAFLHPCGICGAAVAPFGYGVKLKAATNSQDQKLAGRWLCATCRECVGDLS